jgi:hypothetical protein
MNPAGLAAKKPLPVEAQSGGGRKAYRLWASYQPSGKTLGIVRRSC